MKKSALPQVLIAARDQSDLKLLEAASLVLDQHQISYVLSRFKGAIPIWAPITISTSDCTPPQGSFWICVPIVKSKGAQKALDSSLQAIVQARGVVVAVNNASNAGLFAAQLLSVKENNGKNGGQSGKKPGKMTKRLELGKRNLRKQVLAGKLSKVGS